MIQIQSLNPGAGTSELLKDKSTDDLEEKELNRFYKMVRVIQSFDEEELIMEELTIQKRLIHLGLAENGHIFKGTFLCFGKRHQYWQEVTTKNTLLMYNRYLRKYPSGKYVKEADKRLDELENQ